MTRNAKSQGRRTVKQKYCIKKTHTFTIIAMNFVQEQLIIQVNITIGFPLVEFIIIAQTILLKPP